MSSSNRGRQRAKQQAKQIHERFGVSVPVDIESIAKDFGIDVRLEEMENEVSGMLVLRSPRAVIGVNANHHPNRRRFSIAHELGHFLLHREEAQVFVDAAVFFRSEGATQDTWAQEKEANVFAAELLIPEREIRKAWRSDLIDVFDDSAIKRLADSFGVSSQALLIRLAELDLAFQPAG